MTRSMESILQLLGSLQSEVNSVLNAYYIDNAKIMKLQEICCSNKSLRSSYNSEQKQKCSQLPFLPI